MWGILGLVLMVLGGLLCPLVVIGLTRWRADRRLARLRAGLPAQVGCRLEAGSTAGGSRGRLLARGIGGPLAFQPRFRGPRPLAAQGLLLAVEHIPAGMWDNPHLGVCVIHYRTPAGRDLRLRLRATDVEAVSELLTAAPAKPADEPPPRRRGLAALAYPNRPRR